MRNVKMASLIGTSFDRMAGILFKPFSTKKWLRLLLIAFLAGALVGGNGSGGGGRDTSPQKQGVSRESSAKEAPAPKNSAKPAAPKFSPPVIISIIVVVIALILAFIILLTWLGSRFRFVWFNAVANNRDSIREPYYRHAAEANSVFRFSLAVFAALIIFLILDIGGMLYAMHLHGVFQEGFKWSMPIGFKIFLLPAVLLIVVLISLVILAVIFDNFIVPMMALDGIRTMPALRKFGGIFRAQWKDIILFFLVSLGLGIVAGAGEMALAIPVVLILLVLVAIVFGIPFLIIGLALKAKAAFIIYAIAAGIPFAIAAITALFAIALPFAVFFRLFSLNYLISLNAGYAKESLDRYAERRAERVGGKAPIALAIVTIFVIGLIFIGGLLAAIAIPNFVRAKEARTASYFAKPFDVADLIEKIKILIG